jgi:hypothetical protein
MMVVCLGACLAQSTEDPLRSGFQNPPESARPRVWWHWMNGNISKEGIQLDLEWMHRVGIAGFQNFDAALQTPQVVDKRLVYMTPEWKDAFKYAINLGDQLGMEMAIAGSPGWSESGGPWVPPSEGMKKYVWSETFAEGGKPFTGKLPHPPSNTGPFQNIGVRDRAGARGSAPTAPEFYADAAVVAFRAPSSSGGEGSAQPKITSSGDGLDAAMLSDGDLEKTTHVPIPEVGAESWIQFEYPAPQTISSVTWVTRDANGRGAEKTLKVSDDGQNFRDVVALTRGSAPEHTISFEPVTGKYFCVTFKRNPPPAPPPTSYELAELVLHPDPRVNRFEEKAAFVPDADVASYATPQFNSASVIKKDDVVDLTGKMQPDGSLDWTPPEGNWVILRFGYSLLGITNHPASPEATGLEVDKLDHRFVKDLGDKWSRYNRPEHLMVRSGFVVTSPPVP